MTTNSNSAKLGRLSALSLSALVAFAWLATGALLTRLAQAAPPASGTCSITTYYSDPDMTNEVGTYSNCPTEPPKRGLTGKRTRYHDTETVNLGDTGPEHGAGPGSLPCEFTEEGCGNLPKEHHPRGGE